MIKLRDYQEEAVVELRKEMKKGNKKIVLCAPTGAGKTIMFCYMTQNAINNGKKVMIITDRIELISQAGGSLEKFGLKPIEIKAGRDLKSFNGVLYTGMAQTLKRRLLKQEYAEMFYDLDLIIFDECHKQIFTSLFEYINPKTFVIGATATPHRESNQASLDDFYDSIVEVSTISGLINKKFLAKPDSYGVKVDLKGVKTKAGDYDTKTMGDKYDEIKLYHGVYDNYMRVTPNKKAIIFSPNVASSQTLVEDFKSKGLPIEHIDGETPKSERRRILSWYLSTPNAMISNVGILNAGFDCPDIEVVILYRATKSLPLFLQMCGRGSRTTDEKDSFTILDFGNNIKRHGFWQQDRVWSLARAEKKQGEAPVKDCPECFAMLPAKVMECTYCGHEFTPSEKEQDEKVIAELQKLSYNDLKNRLKTADFKELNLIREAKGYKKSWLFHQLKTEEDIINYGKFMGYQKGWAYHQIQLRNK